MSLKSIFRKVGLSLGGLLLACDMGCNARFDEPEPRLEQVVSETPIQPVKKMNKLQYPVNILGGLFLSGTVHEGSHALAVLSMGKKIDDFCLPFMPNDYGRILGYAQCEDLADSSTTSSKDQRAFFRIAGTLGEIGLIESIAYNLRNGKIAKNHQPFWATTSLVTRALMLNNAIQGLKPQDIFNSNDFRGLEANSDITVEQSFGAVLAYTLLNGKNIMKEFKTALGKSYFPDNQRKSGRFEVIPAQAGLGIQYRWDLN